MRNAIVLAAAAALLSAACGTSQPDATISAHVRWLCDVPRFSYDEPQELAERLAVVLSTAGVATEEYDALVAALDTDPALREEVAEAYHRSCGDLS